ncbi:hypothetical protein THIOM_004939 [Candidatus Thiomargarita nelsonii]|uniref:Uncharacterized protein n=1 Tax=Candidatus Thiomargarita nelsonii TaxID=1003181 RepID=A0A176RUK1_9GAMM|nr:hypothetical protein THIOM_004939 [Candidatus Thiomargarita nelsonii]
MRSRIAGPANRISITFSLTCSNSLHSAFLPSVSIFVQNDMSFEAPALLRHLSAIL